MKAETALHFWNIARLHDDPVERITAFARACEQHGVERAKALASATCPHECRECGGEGYDECADDDGDCGPCKGSGESLDKVEIDWSALGAETTLYEDCSVRPATITILTHAHGCQYPSGGVRCTCRWSTEQFRDPYVRKIVGKP